MRRRSRGAPTADVGTAEAFRVLRSNLLVAVDGMEHPTVMVTSALAGEGKTVTAANLARSLSSAGLRVVLVDVDLRHPDVHRLVSADNTVGLTDCLLGRRPLKECLQYVEFDETADSRNGLFVLPTGEPVGNPTELLSSVAMGELLGALSAQADIVVVDAPPVLPVADSLVVGRLVSGALLVVAARSTPISTVVQAKDALTRNQTRIIGMVLNKQQERDLRGGIGYGYGDQPPERLLSSANAATSR